MPITTDITLMEKRVVRNLLYVCARIFPCKAKKGKISCFAICPFKKTNYPQNREAAQKFMSDDINAEQNLPQASLYHAYG